MQQNSKKGFNVMYKPLLFRITAIGASPAFKDLTQQLLVYQKLMKKDQSKDLA